ncbi:MAG: S1C family serine protease [Hydrogenophaga sp.]|nr:S1C family serine protease [Hydrogenophaga sp.]
MFMHHKYLIPLGFALVSALAGAQTALPPEDLFERTSPSVWVVRTLDSSGRPLMQGSAVVIGPGQLITNCHVLRQAKSVSVGRENVSYGAALEHPDTERDLCQLKVANFSAPAVVAAPADALRVGARVYAIGAPRGLETTLSDGLLSGLRRNAQGELEALQITVPLSSGSSGGGLFDAQGRLIGITTSGLRESQNLNFALPAGWIADVPERAKAIFAARQTGLTAAPIAKAGPSGDRVFEYRLTDRMTGLSQPVVYRLDRVDGENLIFNQGTRIERKGGGLVSITQTLGGEFDQASPPDGWISKAPEPGQRWTLKYDRRVDARSIMMSLTAVASEDAPITIGQRTFPTIRVQFRGHTHRGNSGFYNSGPYLANVWYSPDLGRIVRFEVKARGSSPNASIYHIDERLELVDIRSE